ncbi:hypothetical protein GUJ93_ZPchr0001g29371 [Zizania palustris]|uniref:Uncharacterized protein n=1 Tax=Zizania palustris TaxID=103762 RepID=A0A8J5SB48_ZIZPA|nr:hypothetical protein GUJ93_ZPchr0001g29371 [Zizania palustris]
MMRREGRTWRRIITREGEVGDAVMPLLLLLLLLLVNGELSLSLSATEVGDVLGSPPLFPYAREHLLLHGHRHRHRHQEPTDIFRMLQNTKANKLEATFLQESATIKD